MKDSHFPTHTFCKYFKDLKKNKGPLLSTHRSQTPHTSLQHLTTNSRKALDQNWSPMTRPLIKACDETSSALDDNGPTTLGATRSTYSGLGHGRGHNTRCVQRECNRAAAACRGLRLGGPCTCSTPSSPRTCHADTRHLPERRRSRNGPT